MVRAIYRFKRHGKNFVREVQTDPEGISVLATDTQTNNLVRFCVLPNLAECTTFSVDLTLNFGVFYVTEYSYQNKKFKNKGGNDPVHIGAIQIHYRKLILSY